MSQIMRIGHRGAAGHAPENTLAAIRKGIALGADLVEIDLRRTADGEVVVLHDPTVDRTTTGTGRIDRFSLRDIRELDAGDGEHIPTLDEVLDMLRGNTGLMLELKVEGLAHNTVAAVRKAGFKPPVIYASFLHDELTEVRSADPTAALMVLFGRVPSAPVARAMRYRPSHVGLRQDTVTRRLLDACHREGLLVFAYTADHPSDIQRAMSFGVDGVISNFPERIAQEGEPGFVITRGCR